MLVAGRLGVSQQLFQRGLFPSAQQLHRVGTVRLQRVENVSTSLGAVAAVAVVERVAIKPQ